ncbi:MAG TPA: hypothetical protein VFL89_05440 [Solirubrobacterales bacterium]|nr:hypothetical protein [Solirubrobacterales bacterium]
MPDSSEVVEREDRWTVRSGIAAMAGAILGVAGFVLLQAALSGGANFEGLREAHANASTLWISGVATGISYLLLAAPLLFLFRAAQARSERVRNQMVGVVLLGPLLLGVAAFLLAGGTQDAANTYIEGKSAPTRSAVKEAPEECRSEAKDKSAKDFSADYPAEPGSTSRQACQDKKIEESRASEAIRGSTLVSFAQYMGLAGGLALVVSLFYCGLWGMRTGLLTRFWGSLGMASGVAALIGLSPLVLIWFFYLGLLLIGKVPGGRPPAWAAGEAIPWPTPGEQAAAQLDGAEPGAGPAAGDPATSERGGGGGEAPRRKRKQRD